MWIASHRAHPGNGWSSPPPRWGNFADRASERAYGQGVMSANYEEVPQVNRCLLRHGPETQPTIDPHLLVVGEEDTCDTPISGPIDMTPFEQDLGTPTTQVSDAAMLQLRGLMAGLGLVARPVL
jgi:hypothetical protein